MPCRVQECFEVLGVFVVEDESGMDLTQHSLGKVFNSGAHVQNCKVASAIRSLLFCKCKVCETARGGEKRC